MAKFSVLSPEQRLERNAWLGIVFGVSQGKDSPIFAIGHSYNKYIWKAPQYFSAKDADTILQFLLDRPVSDIRYFTQLDDALDHIDYFKFVFEDSSGALKYVKTTMDKTTKYIADFIAEKEFYFRDTNWTLTERDLYLQTAIGKTLAKFGCFVSQRLANQTSSKAASTTPKSTNGPAIPYKSLGPLSDQITILVSGNKEIFTDNGINTIYCIEGTKTGANVPTAFITPVTLDGKSINPSKARIVNFSSGNGYNNGKLYFTDAKEAQDFCNKVIQKFGSNRGIQVKKIHPEVGKGFYEVETEFGLAWIKAKVVNEAMLEAVNAANINLEEDSRYKYCAGNDLNVPEQIKDIDIYEESFSREMY